MRNAGYSDTVIFDQVRKRLGSRLEVSRIVSLADKTDVLNDLRRDPRPEVNGQKLVKFPSFEWAMILLPALIAFVFGYAVRYIFRGPKEPEDRYVRMS
jgi:hypothetical protein